MKYEVKQLTDVSEDTLEKLSTWMYNWWGKESGRTFEAVKSFMRHSMQKDRLPQTYGMFVDNEIVGMFQITYDDLFSRPDIYPWIANVYIAEEYRGLGYGRLMLEQVSSIVREHTNFEKVYGYTKHVGLYEKFGWEYIEPIETFDKNNTIERFYEMEIERENSIEKSPLHQNRIVFALVDNSLKISDTNKEHKDWLRTMNINEEGFEITPRGYILQTSDTSYHVVSYIGKNFYEYELDEETKRQLEIFIRLHHGTSENIVVIWYAGVKIGRIGETWEPLHHVDTTYPKNLGNMYLTELEKLRYINILSELFRENMGEKVITCVRNELKRLSK